MMATVTLQPNDPRLGTCDASGAIQTWPAVTYHNAPYDAVNATIRRIDGQYFVVFGTGRDDPELALTVAAAAAPATRRGAAATESSAS